MDDRVSGVNIEVRVELDDDDDDAAGGGEVEEDEASDEDC